MVNNDDIWQALSWGMCIRCTRYIIHIRVPMHAGYLNVRYRELVIPFAAGATWETLPWTDMPSQTSYGRARSASTRIVYLEVRNNPHNLEPYNPQQTGLSPHCDISFLQPFLSVRATLLNAMLLCFLNTKPTSPDPPDPCTNE